MCEKIKNEGRRDNNKTLVNITRVEMKKQWKQ